MRVIVKIILTLVAFLIYGIIQIIVKGGDASKAGAGGPVGMIFLFAFIAGVTAIWKYNPDKNKKEEITPRVEDHKLKKD